MNFEKGDQYLKYPKAVQNRLDMVIPPNRQQVLQDFGGQIMMQIVKFCKKDDKHTNVSEMMYVVAFMVANIAGNMREKMDTLDWQAACEMLFTLIVRAFETQGVSIQPKEQEKQHA